MKSKSSVWRIIAKSLGTKEGKNNQEADRIALVRLLITLQILITNFFIIFGVARTHIFPTSPKVINCVIHK